MGADSGADARACLYRTPRKWSLREIVNAILYVPSLWSGIEWVGLMARSSLASPTKIQVGGSLVRQ